MDNKTRSPQLPEKGLCSSLGSFDGLVDPPLGEGPAVAVVDGAAILVFPCPARWSVACRSASHALQAALAIERGVYSPQSPERR